MISSLPWHLLVLDVEAHPCHSDLYVVAATPASIHEVHIGDPTDWLVCDFKATHQHGYGICIVVNRDGARTPWQAALLHGLPSSADHMLYLAAVLQYDLGSQHSTSVSV